MSTSLQSQLQQLATTFADSVLTAIRAASIKELLAESGASRPSTSPASRTPAASAKRMPSPKSSDRLARRTAEQIAVVVDRIVALVKKHKSGLRAEQIRVELGILSKEMPRVLKDGLAAKKLTAKGQKRATTYFAK